MRPASAYNTSRLSDSSRKRPSSSYAKKDSRVIAWKPIIIDSINTSNHISKGTIIDLERDVDLDDKINLESRNLFNSVSLPHDHINTLKYSNNYISKIEKLQHLRYLQYLDFSDNHLVEISGLPDLPCLKALLLGRNRIKKISGLEAQVNLDVLDLSNNFIQEIQGLEKLQNLRVLNLESNEIRNVPDIGYLTALVELNLKKNQISAISPMSLILVKRLILGYNLLNDVKVVDIFSNCSQLLELNLEGNPCCSDSAYRSCAVVRIKSLKFLDGKRITEEERRTCMKLEKRASEKRIEAEKILQRDNEKKSILESIERSWDQSKREVFIYPTPQSKKSNSKSYGAFKKISAKSQVYDGGFYKVTNAHLEIFGNALNVLENLDPSVITSISFNMIHIEDILRFYPVLVKYRYLIKISFNRTMIEYLTQFNRFKSFDIHDISISDMDNPINALKITKNYLIYIFQNLMIFQGQSITEAQKNNSWVKFGPLRQTLSQISPRLLSKNQAKYQPFSYTPLKKKCFSGFNSDNESIDSDGEDPITSVNERLSACRLISCALKQKKMIHEFEIKWKDMIDDVLVNH